MRPELEKIKKIEAYLTGKLNDAEKRDFESQMKNDPELARDVELQRIVVERVKGISLKKDISGAHGRYRFGNYFSAKNVLAYAAVITVVVAMTYYFINKNDQPVIPHTVAGNPIQPPIKGIDVPFTTNSFDAEKGEVLRYKTGSTVIVPPGALVDENGNEVKGDVEVKFREFTDAADIYIAGIPMNYGDQYLESAAMCEINAYKDGKPLKLKSGKNIEIMQASYTTSKAFNLYYFDRKEGRWIEKGKDVAVDLSKNKEEKTAKNETRPAFNVIKPQKSSPDRFKLTVDFLEEEFPEMAGFRDVEFEVDDNDKQYRPEDADVQWESVRIAQGSIKGTYNLFFKNKTRKAQYLVYPVFEGVQYDEAMKIYNRKLAEYNKKYNQRMTDEKRKQDEFARQTRYVDSVNKAIEARTSEVRQYNSRVDSLNKIIIAKNDSVRKVKAKNEEILKISVITNLMYYVQELLYSNLLSKKDSVRIMDFCKNQDEVYANRGYINDMIPKLRLAQDLNDKRLQIISCDVMPNDIVLKLQLNQVNISNIISLKDFIETQFTIMSEKMKTELLKRWEENQRKAVIIAEKQNLVYRSYSANNFGLWNSDCPASMPKGLFVNAKFRYNNEDLNQDVTLVDKNIRGLFNYYIRYQNRFQFNPKSDNLVWCITEDNKLAYFNRFKDIPESQNGKLYVFDMAVLEEKLETYEQVKELIGKL